MSDVSQEERGRTVDCPICGMAMAVEKINRADVDVCGEHGIWLDHGELAVILERERATLEATQADQIEQARKDGKAAGAILGWWSLFLG